MVLRPDIVFLFRSQKNIFIYFYLTARSQLKFFWKPAFFVQEPVATHTHTHTDACMHACNAYTLHDMLVWEQAAAEKITGREMPFSGLIGS